MQHTDFKYCNSLTSFSRFKTREVNIGGVPMGGDNPIRIQTMTNTNTLDTQATIEQFIRCINAGAEYVRITAPGTQDAENLANIKNGLRKLGYQTPLIADIHFNYKAAEVAAAIVEKVRINPGNYADTKTFKQLNYTEAEYNAELEKIHKKVLPLLDICKQHGTAIRIGVNHGSLSDRVMSRYGDTPQGMVESAMEFLRIFEKENFHNVVLSLKASNTRIMVQAYRILVNQMMHEGMNYPLHLGVTEAGDGEDGRIKSAVGIGALLADGIGDTVRVSLTEDPEVEIPVAQNLVSYFQGRTQSHIITEFNNNLKNPFEYQRRESIGIKNIGGNKQPIIIVDWIGSDAWKNSTSVLAPDYYYLNPGSETDELPGNLSFMLNLKSWVIGNRKSNIFPVYTDAEFVYYGEKSEQLNFVILENRDFKPALFEALSNAKRTVIILETYNLNGFADQRSVFMQLLERGINLPVIINRNYCEDSTEILQLKSASDIGALLIDGFGDGIWLRNAGLVSFDDTVSTAFGILQASRVRTSKTEYISCPSCGRTLFDLQTTTAQIKQRTNHLKHLKIGIMGCIVNGPGEMADADYGYVGAAPGKVTLYKGKEVVKKNIDATQAVNELIQLIKDNGDWVDA